ncbi:hypothetical protein HYW55_02340 [Candidatus Gottesmanbacteria bacterium]|nr:hypothetical protein [Candidatus Gottesmanbacteria bacterium]
MNDVLIVGDVTIDQNRIETGTYVGPGGPVYFGGKTFLNLGDQVTLIAPYGEDFPKETTLTGAQWIPQTPAFKKTLVFKNILERDGERRQFVEHVSDVSNFYQTYVNDTRLRNRDILIVAPLLPRIPFHTLQTITSGKKSLRVLLPQGMYRKVLTDQSISHGELQDEEKILRMFDVVILSERDSPTALSRALSWSLVGPLVVVTKAGQGCMFFQNGIRTHVPAFTVEEIVDSTGSGDIFAAAFAHTYAKFRSAKQAAIAGHAVAGLSLRFGANQLQYRLADLYAFAQRQGRNIRL